MLKAGKWLIGADPEVFVQDVTTRKGVSAHNLVGGTKNEPIQKPFGQVLPDGLALEFGIKPTRTKDRWVSRINRALASLDRTIKKKNPNYALAMKVPSMTFDKDLFDALPEEAKELGCDPDYNAYTLRHNPPPGISGDVPFRCVGGHVHFGFRSELLPPHLVHHPDNIKLCSLIVRLCDIYMGVPNLLFDQDTERRKQYGAAGSFRPKVYGFEYRTLSNRWLMDTTLTEWVFDQAKLIENVVTERKMNVEQILEISESAKSIIQSSSAYRAVRFCERLGIEVPKPPSADYVCKEYYERVA